MNPKMVAVRAGIRRGVIEIRQTLTNGADLSNYLFFR
jgi:ABC-2 type transport system permease protein